MNFPTDNPAAGTLTSPVRHELDLAEVRAVPTLELPELHKALSMMIDIANMSEFRTDLLAGRHDKVVGGFLCGLAEYLGDLREAIVVDMEDRRPATAEEAQERARLLLHADIAAGATLPEIGELLDRVAAEREPVLS